MKLFLFFTGVSIIGGGRANYTYEPKGQDHIAPAGTEHGKTHDSAQFSCDEAIGDLNSCNEFSRSCF